MKSKLGQLRADVKCKNCGMSNFSMIRGISDEHPESIEVMCGACGFVFSSASSTN